MRKILLTSACIGLFSATLLNDDTQAGATSGGPAESPAAKGVRPPMQIYIDPETGELLEQPPEGVNTIPAKPADATVEEMEQVKSSVPGGGIKVDVRGHFQTPIEDRIGADGQPVLRRGVTPSAPPK